MHSEMLNKGSVIQLYVYICLRLVVSSCKPCIWKKKSWFLGELTVCTSHIM